MSGISTKNIPSSENSGGGNFIRKEIAPGNVKACVREITLEKQAYAQERPEWQLFLKLETEPIGGTFKGFDKVFGDPSKGQSLGQTAKVKTSRWNLYDGHTPQGYEVSIQNGVLGTLQTLFQEIGAMDYWNQIDGLYPTIQEFVAGINTSKKFDGIFINWCIAGREYTNKKGYTTTELYLPKPVSGFKLFCGDATKVLKYNPSEHLIKLKPPTTLKDGFSAEPVKQNGISTKNVSATPITDEIQKEGVQTTGAKTITPAQSNEEWIKEMNQVETEGSDIVTGNEEESELPFSLE